MRTALGGGNTIGSIPQALGGGLVALSRIAGTTSDNIVSARLVTATGELITVDNSTPDLLWALKGAGQFFGMVTELTLRTYPLSILGTDDGTIYSANLIFDISKTGEIAKVAHKLMDIKDQNAANLAVIVSNPEMGSPVFLFICMFLGPAIGAENYLAPLKALGPMMVRGESVEYPRVNDSADPFTIKGDFKKLEVQGLPEFNPEPWQRIADAFVETTKKFPDIVMGGYGFEFTTGTQKPVELDSAWAHRDVKVWM